MVPPLLILGGVVVGLLASGCFHEVKPPEAPPSPPKPPEDPKPDFSESSNALAYWLHKKLVEKGHSPRAMDQGVYRIPFATGQCPSRPGTPCVEQAGDKSLSAEEVWDFAFEEHKKYDGTAEEILGRPLPWVLDDYNPNTSDDEVLRKKVKAAIAKLDELLQKNKLAKGSPEYQERMAVGLFYLVALPDAEGIKKDPAQFQKLSDELAALGLEDYRNFLQERGGLRIMQYDESVELSALEAVREGRGKSTEHAKLLYGVLRMAGLSPDFVYANPQKSKDPVLGVQTQLNPHLHHVCVGLKVGDKLRLLDPVLATSRPAHEEHFLLSPRQFLALEYIQHGMAAAAKGDGKRWAQDFELSRALDPNSPFLALHQGIVAFSQEKPDEAVKAFNRAIDLYPHYSLAYFLLGNLKVAKEDWTGAEQAFTGLIQSAPNFSNGYFNRSYARFQKKDEKGALEDLQTLINLQPDEGHLRRGLFYAQKKDWNQAMADLNKALELNPILAEAYGARGTLWGAKGDLKKASADFLKLLKLTPNQMSINVAFQGTAPIYFRKWSDPHLQQAHQKIGGEIGVDAVKAETWFKVIGIIWESGNPPLALEALKSFTSEIQKMKNASKQAKNALPPYTRSLLNSLYQTLPPAMQKNPKAKKAMQDLV